MKIAVIGRDMLDCQQVVCLSEIGHHVICIDVDEQKVDLLKSRNLTYI